MRAFPKVNLVEFYCVRVPPTNDERTILIQAFIKKGYKLVENYEIPAYIHSLESYNNEYMGVGVKKGSLWYGVVVCVDRSMQPERMKIFNTVDKVPCFK